MTTTISLFLSAGYAKNATTRGINKTRPSRLQNDLLAELFAGCFGWSIGWLEMGGRSIGFDLEHLEHHGEVPAGAQLVIQDVRTIHGSQLKNVSLILASPPCTEYSYMAMPWKRSKQIAAALVGQAEFPAGYTGSRTIEELNSLFNACFRIQREASEAAGHHIPMVVENVCGAQKWVGRAKWKHGNWYLWGDVPVLMPRVLGKEGQKGFSHNGTRKADWPHNHIGGAMAAKIPEPLARHIARVFKP